MSDAFVAQSYCGGEEKRPGNISHTGTGKYFGGVPGDSPWGLEPILPGSTPAQS